MKQARCNNRGVSTEGPPGWIPLEVSYGRDQWDSETCWVVHLRELSEIGRISFIVPPEERGAALLSDSRPISRNSSSPETRSGWGQARPACPGHPHPATPSWDEQTDTAWWQAPQQAVTSLPSATTARTNTTGNRTADGRTFEAQSPPTPRLLLRPRGSGRLTSPSRRDLDSSDPSVNAPLDRTLARSLKPAVAGTCLSSHLCE